MNTPSPSVSLSRARATDFWRWCRCPTTNWKGHAPFVFLPFTLVTLVTISYESLIINHYLLFIIYYFVTYYYLLLFNSYSITFRFSDFGRRGLLPSPPLSPPLLMDFTDLYRHTHAQVSFSPGRHFILTAINDRIVVRKSSTFTITASFQADLTPSTTSSVLAGKPSAKLFAAEASITQCTWSPDSEYILAACPRRGIVNIFALRDTTWNARIEAGVEGLVRAEWAPDSRHIFCFSEFGVRSQVLVRLWVVLIACIVATGHDLVSCYRYCDIYPVPQVCGERSVGLIGLYRPGLGLKLPRTRLSKRCEVLCPCGKTQVQRRNRRVRHVRFLQARKSKLETSPL